MVGESSAVGSKRNEHEDDATIPLKSTGQQQLATSPCADDDMINSTSSSKFVYVLAFFSAIGGFLFGYDTGVVSGAMLIIRYKFNFIWSCKVKSHFLKFKSKEMELSNGWHEAIVSATIAAAWIFSLFGGYLSGTSIEYFELSF